MSYVSTIERLGIKQGIEQGLAQGIKQGVLTGITHGKQQIIHRMLQMGQSLETISTLTGLDINEIDKLSKEPLQTLELA